MDYQIKGKLAFVTAGAHGIGEAIANLLAQEGVDVIVADQNEAALKEKGGAWCATFAANLATAEGMDSAISHMVGAFGRAPDILVNNLGLADAIPFESFSDEQWARAVDINLMGCVRIHNDDLEPILLTCLSRVFQREGYYCNFCPTLIKASTMREQLPLLEEESVMRKDAGKIVTDQIIERLHNAASREEAGKRAPEGMTVENIRAFLAGKPINVLT